MYDYDKIIDVLNEKSMQFTRQEILDMMNEELQKEPGEMDADLVELCIDVLDGKYVCADDTAKEDKRPRETTYAKRMRIRKALLVAAIFAVILAITIPAGAKFVHMDATDDVVAYHANHFSIDLSQNKELKAVVADSVLPQAFLNDDTIYDMEISDTDTILYFKDNSSDIYGNVIISNNDKENFVSGLYDMNDEFYSAEEINVNGIKALVIQSEDLNTVVYLAGDKEYTITIHNCDFETAKQIANTIGEK